MQVIDALNTYSAAITAIATVVLVLITLYYAIVTRGLLTENRKLREAGTEPHVVAFIHPHNEIGGIIDLTIQNVGFGPAFELSISVLGEVTALKARGVRLSPLEASASFPTFPQNHKLTLFFAVGHQLLEEPTPPDMSLVLKYKDSRGRNLQNNSKLSFEVFSGMTPENNSLRRDTNNRLKDISNALDKVARQLATVNQRVIASQSPEKNG